MKTRTIVVPLITNQYGEYLLCRMPKDRGVFPGQWGISGGGIEPGEKMLEALAREIKEELGIIVDSINITPWAFRDDVRIKTYPDGKKENIYMIYLLFDCVIDKDTKIQLNDEFDKYAWVAPQNFDKYDLNDATKITLSQALSRPVEI